MAGTSTAGRRSGMGRGFTLVEVMIVIVIILAIAGLVTYNLMGARDRATSDTTALQLKQIRGAIQQFQLDFNRLPTDDEGLAVLWSKESLSPEADASRWRAYMDQPLATDTWGTAWGYRTEGQRDETPEGKFDLWSYGPDKQDGTDDDISVWPKTSSSDPSGMGPSGPSGRSRP